MQRFEYTLFSVAILLAVMGLGWRITHPGSDNAPAPSYYERNLEELKSAQPNDLIICIIEGEGSGVSKLLTKASAFLVDQNAGESLYGVMISKRGRNLLDQLAYSSWSPCKVTVLKPPASYEAIGRIYTHGIDSYQPPNTKLPAN